VKDCCNDGVSPEKLITCYFLIFTSDFLWTSSFLLCSGEHNHRDRLAANNVSPAFDVTIQHGNSQLAQKTSSSRNDRTSRVCTGLVGRLAQGRNIRSPAALAA
jgi:hypothetical protein